MANTTTAKIEEHIEMAKERLFGLVGINVTSGIHKEREGDEYGACTFELNDHPVCFRVAKITPRKNGQFLTLWRRVAGKIIPLQEDDPAHLFIVSVQDGERFGQFVFPKNILCERKILKSQRGVGKLAMRVYPAWVNTESKQASITQNWQLQYFIDASPGVILDLKKAKDLFKCR